MQSTFSPGRAATRRLASAGPLISGITTSVTTRSIGHHQVHDDLLEVARVTRLRLPSCTTRSAATHVDGRRPCGCRGPLRPELHEARALLELAVTPAFKKGPCHEQ